MASCVVWAVNRQALTAPGKTCGNFGRECARMESAGTKGGARRTCRTVYIMLPMNNRHGTDFLIYNPNNVAQRSADQITYVESKT
eukprot:3185734-Pyramimonas_sp.AAC.1